MGFNTAMIVLNDCLNETEGDQHFGAKVSQAIREVSYSRDGRTYTSGFTVLPSEHADYVQIVAIGGNTIRRLGGSFRYEPEHLLRDLADQMGFTLRRKPGSPT